MEKWERITEKVIAILSEFTSKRRARSCSNRLDSETRLNQFELDPSTWLIIARKIEQHFKVDLAEISSFETTQDIIDHVLFKTNTCNQQALLTTFFRDVWSSDATLNKSSANDLVEEINSQKPRNVLDIGCGDNFFKDKIHNLTGIDIVNPRADIICDFMDFDPAGEKFDIILALGSINFGSRKYILSILRRVKMLLDDHGKVYMRVNPGVSWPQQPELIIYPWTENKIKTHGSEVGFDVAGKLKYEYGKYGPRISFIYVHSSNDTKGGLAESVDSSCVSLTRSITRKR